MGRSVGACLLLLLTACAHIAPPPGGPEDKVPPVLLSTRPESLGVYPAFKGSVEFRFDEVVSEGSSASLGIGTSDLEHLILLSPTREFPVVRWGRDKITVRPKEGWQPNRVYRVELLPGVVDLRRNRSDTTTTLTFSTGAPLPTDTLSGVAVDWPAGRLAQGAIIEMVLGPDSLVYRAISDSSGGYNLGPLPRGDYVVFASLDQNKNLRRDHREPFDSIRMPAESLHVPPLWIYPHDSIGPRIASITPNDSISATVVFTQPLDPYQRMDSLPVRVRLLPDSTPVGVRSLLPKDVDDSLQKLASARADSARARDTTAAAPPGDTSRVRKPEVDTTRIRRPLLKKPGFAGKPVAPVDSAAQAARENVLRQRPPLTDKLVVRADSAFLPGAKYLLEVDGIRNVNRAPADVRSGFSIPKPKPPSAADSLKAAGHGDSIPPADSTAAPAKPR